jgi:hypothetical protein
LRLYREKCDYKILTNEAHDLQNNFINPETFCEKERSEKRNFAYTGLLCRYDGLTYFRFFQAPRHHIAIPVGDSVPVTRFIPSQLSLNELQFSKGLSTKWRYIHSQLLRFIEYIGYTIHFPGHFFFIGGTFWSWAQLKETEDSSLYYPHLNKITLRKHGRSK